MILHVDMDAFYASVEQADSPQLKGKCVIIGGMSNRSVVSAASYEARRFGISSAMPMYEAKKKCPEGIILPVRMDRYKTISKQIMVLLDSFSPLLEQVSIDEAYMDISGCELLYGGFEETAVLIKKKIRDNFDLTCSIGAAPVKFLAKIASDYKKPDGLTIITPEQVEAFIDSLPIRKVPGIGEKTYDTLKELGIKYLGDVKQYPERTLIQRLGRYGQKLIELSKAIDPSPVSPHKTVKSIGSEETFLADTRDLDVLKTHLLKQSEDVSRMLRKRNVKARSVMVKVKYSNFKQTTRQEVLSTPTQSTKAIYKTALKLLETYPTDQKIRLVGVIASSLLPEDLPVQMNLFNDTAEHNQNWEKVGRVVDDISKKFGRGIVQKAGLIGKKNTV